MTNNSAATLDNTDPIIDDTLGPFSTEIANGGYFVDEFRKLTLNKLCHLAPYCGVLLVKGVVGSGKSALLHQLTVKIGGNWRSGLIQCSPLLDSATLLRNIASAFDLHSDQSESIDETRQTIINYIEALGRSSRQAILIFDDAHELTAAAWQALSQLVEENHTTNALGLVLAGEPQLEEILHEPALQTMLNRLTYTQEIPPLEREGVADYIRQRLTIAGMESAIALFDNATIERLYKESGGILSHINRLASTHLSQKNREASTTEKSHATNRNMKQRILFGIVATVVVAILLLQDQINSLFESDTQPAAQVALNTTPKVDASPLTVAPSTPQKPQQSATASHTIDTMDQQDDPVDSLSVSDSPASDQAVIDKIVVTEPRPIEEPIKTEPKPKAEPEIAVSISPPKPVPAPQPFPWIMRQSPQHFTLQLMAVADTQRVEKFIQHHNAVEKTKLFQALRGGKVLNVLIYGSYPSLAAALKAGESLPKSWNIKQPWARSFSTVQQDIRNTMKR